jgi:hypothetical protein
MHRPRRLSRGPLTPRAPSGGTGRVKVRRAHRNGHSPGHDSRLRASVYDIPPSGVNGGPARISGAIPSGARPDPPRGGESGTRRADDRHDAGLDRLGQLGPGGHDPASPTEHGLNPAEEDGVRLGPIRSSPEFRVGLEMEPQQLPTVGRRLANSAGQRLRPHALVLIPRESTPRQEPSSHTHAASNHACQKRCVPSFLLAIASYP